jgi:hypothetical protein
MSRTLRRLALLLLAGAGAGAYATMRRQRLAAADHPTSAAWPPFEPVIVAPVAEAVRWVAPVDGTCPPGYPVKANDNSGIFHIPGGRFYERTVPERCYADADDAVADGYRAAKA